MRAEPPVTVLLSAGRNPDTQQPRRAPQDARALEIAMRLCGGDVMALHAGHADEPALFEYLGMGLKQITLLSTPSHAKGLSRCIAEEIGRSSARLVLSGMRAETGAGSGLLPYAVARALDAQLIPGAIEVECAEGLVRCLIKTASGSLRRVETALPAVVTVSHDAPEPRGFVFAAARNGRVEQGGPCDPAPAQPLYITPRQSRPRPISSIRGGTSWDRIRQLVDGEKASGYRIEPETAEEAADALIEFLVSNGVWPQIHSDGVALEHNLNRRRAS